MEGDILHYDIIFQQVVTGPPTHSVEGGRLVTVVGVCRLSSSSVMRHLVILMTMTTAVASATYACSAIGQI